MDENEESNTLDIREDLHLKSINFPKIAENVTVSDELNFYLRSQLEQMKNENAALQQKLCQNRSKLQKSEAQVEELSKKSEFTSAAQLANCKIVELGKKLRDKTAEIETYKHKCSKLENAVSELQKQVEIEEENVTSEKESYNEDETKKLQDKLTYTTNKWVEEKNNNLKLKNDLKKANKWLQQEVGETFETLSTLHNSPSNWRGRAQVICDLQQKNLELKEKLKAYQDNIKNGTETTVKTDKRLEMLNRENLEIRNSFDELKRKFEATKARSKVLETECNLMRSKISDLNQNREADQEMIENLQAQVSGYNHQMNEDLKQKIQVIKKLQQENESLKIELAKEKCLSENKSQQLTEKNSDIQILNKRIRSARPTSSYIRKPESPETKTANRLEVERLRLLELTQVQNKRLQEERDANMKTQHLLRLERQKGAKLEANLARLQLEQNSARSIYSSRSSTNMSKLGDSELSDKLELAEENIKALTTRLELEELERKKDLEQLSKILD